MEGLSNEKRQLEDRLIREKSMMTSESQGLSDQLKSCQHKLSETEDLLVKEANLRRQLQEIVDRLESEKQDLQNLLQNNYDENDQLRSRQMQLQAKSQKDDIAIDNLRKKTAEQEIFVTDLQSQLDLALAAKATIESEKEELLNQVEILTEERDICRLNEERLFETLRDRTNDLEKLQESYVDMTDRCNDYQDEMSDLREKVELLQELVSENQQVKPTTTVDLGQLVGKGISYSSSSSSPRALINSKSEHLIRPTGSPNPNSHPVHQINNDHRPASVGRGFSKNNIEDDRKQQHNYPSRGQEKQTTTSYPNNNNDNSSSVSADYANDDGGDYPEDEFYTKEDDYADDFND